MIERTEKCVAKEFERRWTQGRAIYGCDHGGIAASVENVTQTDLQGAELAELRIGIADEICSAGADSCSNGFGILARHNDGDARERVKRDDC
jgi:hypothetical protein